MLRRALRLVLVSSLGLALWFVALPARASTAPFCDDRGASALAPPPTLVGGDPTTQIGRLDVSCEGEDILVGATITRGHPTPVPAPDAPDPYLASAALAVVPPTGEELDRPPSEPPRTEDVRSRIERPPRG